DDVRFQPFRFRYRRVRGSGLADYLDLWIAGQHQLEPFADDGMVVHQQDTDRFACRHEPELLCGMGRVKAMRTPWPGCEMIVKSAPMALARTPMLLRPCRPGLEATGSNPMPSSRISIWRAPF